MDFNDVAERIIQVEGLTFALASLSVKPGDLALAREALKKAIVDALETVAKSTTATTTL